MAALMRTQLIAVSVFECLDFEPRLMKSTEQAP